MNNIYSIHLFNKITFSVFIKIKDDKAFGIASLRRVGSGFDSANGLGQELSYSSLPLSSYTNRIISLHTLWSQKICIPFYPFADQPIFAYKVTLFSFFLQPFVMSWAPGVWWNYFENSFLIILVFSSYICCGVLYIFMFG